MESDSSQQASLDQNAAGDPLFGNLATDPNMAPTFDPYAPVTTAADLPALGFTTSGNPIGSSIFSSVPGWGWAVLIGLAGVLIIARR